MAYSMYKELQSPTGAEHAVWAKLMPSTNAAQLVVARGTVLDIYMVAGRSTQASSAAQLQVLATFQLPGDVCGLEVLTLTGRGAASVAGLKTVATLVVSFGTGKISIVGLDPFTLKLQTLGMLNFEQRGVGPGCSVQAQQIMRHASGVANTGAVRVDPDGRALVTMPYDNQLAVVPVRRAIEGLDDLDDKDIEEDAAVAAAEKDAAASAAVSQDRVTRQLLHKPYIVDLHDIGSGLSGAGLSGVVSDIAFLHGYSVQPTVCILVKTAVTNSIRLSSLQHTTTLAAVSLDTTGTATPVVWQRDGLPHDAYSLAAVPSPVGGALIISPNAIQHLDHTKSAGLALNGHAAYTVDCRGKYKLDTNVTHDAYAPHICLQLDAVRTAVIAPDLVLLTEVSGAVFLLRLHTMGRGEVHHMTLLPTNVRIPPASALCWQPGPVSSSAAVCASLGAAEGSLAAGLLFVASRVTDSVLLAAAVRTMGGNAALQGYGLGTASVRTLVGGPVLGPVLAESLEADDELLYGGAPAQDAPSPPVQRVSPGTDGTGRGRKRPRPADDEEEAAPGMEGEGLPDHAAGLGQEHSPVEDEDTFLYGQGQGGSGQEGTGEGGVSSSTLPLLILHPVDALPSLGPVLDATMARSARVPTEEDEEPPLAPPPTELVLASSRHESGCITVVHRALRPAVASQLRLGGCTALFSLSFTEGGGKDSGAGLVLVSSDTATRVLAVGEGLSELPPLATELVTGTCTLAAASLLQPGAVIEDEDEGALTEDKAALGRNGSQAAAALLHRPHAWHPHDGSRSILVQVHSAGVRVTRAEPGTAVVQDLSLFLPADVGGLGAGPGTVITAACHADPFVLVRLSDGSLRFLTAQEADGELLVDEPSLPGHPRDIVTALSLYRDEDGALAAALGGTPSPSKRAYAFLARRSGRLEIYALPSFTLLFTTHAMHIAPHCAVNAMDSEEERHVKGHPAAAIELDGIAEPCEDRGVEYEGKAVPPLPRTFIKELCALPVEGRVALVLVNSRDDIFTYILHLACMIGPEQELHLPMGPLVHTASMQPLGPASINMSIPRIGQGKVHGSAHVGLIEDVGRALQVHRAAQPRLVRLPHTPGGVTRRALADGPDHDPVAAEAALRHPTRTILRPFRDVSGWRGLAALTAVPLLLLSFRGTLVSLHLGVPDVVGAAGPTGLPGEHLPWGGAGAGPIVSAFTPFSSFFCPSGFIYAHAGHVQFATLPRPQWGSSDSGMGGEAEGLPRPVPAWLVTIEDGSAPALAHGPTVLALAGVTQAEAGGSMPLAMPSSCPWPSVAADRVYAPQLTPHALIVPGPAFTPFYRWPQGGRTVHRLAYMEHASGSMGGQALLDVYRARKAAAAAEGAPPPLPPSAAQLACCVQPLFAACMSVRALRSYEAEQARVSEGLDGGRGEYEQVNYGDHIEWGPVPMPTVHRPHARNKAEEPPAPIQPDPIAEAFNAAGLGRPPAWDTRYSVVLMWGGGAEAGRGWDALDSHELEPDEHVTCVREIPIADTPGGRPEPAIVVGTSFLTHRGEDFKVKGRLLLFRLAHVSVPTGGDDGASVSMPRLRLAFEEDVKCVPSVLVGVTGTTLSRMTNTHVLVGAGKRLHVYEWHTAAGIPRLRLCSFIDFRTWCTSLEVVRDFIIAADAHGGIFFYQWREEDRQLLPLCQAHDVPGLTAASALVHGDNMRVVTLDMHGNVGLHEYAPVHSFVPMRTTGDFRIGAAGAAEKLVRSRLSFPGGTPPADRRKHGVLVPTHAGGIGLLLPLEEPVYKRLAMLQRVLTYCCPHPGGLNPRLQRMVYTPDAPGRAVKPAGNVLDGPLLARYCELSTASSASLAASVGTTADRVMANLRDVDMAAIVF